MYATCNEKGILKKFDKCFKFTCLHCGYNKMYSNSLNNSVHKLWLRIELNDIELWAYNLELLAFLKNHISAGLKERTLENISNKSIGSRLPKWMTSKKIGLMC